MAKLAFLIAVVAFALYAEAVPIAAGNPNDVASNFMPFDVKPMSDPGFMANMVQASGNSVGTMMSTHQETVMENGEPVQKYVTDYMVKKDGKIYSGTIE